MVARLRRFSRLRLVCLRREVKSGMATIDMFYGLSPVRNQARPSRRSTARPSQTPLCALSSPRPIPRNDIPPGFKCMIAQLNVHLGSATVRLIRTGTDQPVDGHAKAGEVG